jgi:hypothetical protein
MKHFFLLVLFLAFSSTSNAVEQYWTEQIKGVNHACYSPGFWAMIRGTRTCSPYNGDTPPDSRTLRVAAVAPKDELQNYAEANRKIQEFRMARDSAQKKVENLEKGMADLFPCSQFSIHQLREHAQCLERSQEEMGRVLPQIQEARENIRRQKQLVDQFDQQLSLANQEVKTREDRARLSNLIIANKDVYQRLDRLDGRLDKASDTLDSIERAFDRSILEAYIAQKLEKLGRNLCQANSQCSASTDEASRTLLNGVFDLDQIKQDATGRTRLIDRTTR